MEKNVTGPANNSKEATMTAEERAQRIEQLKHELSELRKVKSSHGAHAIDFQMLEIEDEIAELRSAAAE
ncbi:MAG: hypothetical protein ACYCW5_02395 [Thermoleophilia bacterium]